MLFSVPIQRFVVDHGGEYSVDEDGIRSDSAWWAPDTTRRGIAELSRDVSLAILGEPGIGKSTVIGQMVADDVTVNHVRLDEATDPETLDQLLEPTRTASSGTGRTTLVLDALDECPLPPKLLIRKIVATLTGRADVRVVVGCRTADWSTGLGDALRDALDSFGVVELLPLSAEDIQSLAHSRGIDGAMFIRAVRGAAAGPLATLPLTLDLLLSLYAQNGELPSDPLDLYQRGLLILADEPDKDRAEARRQVGSGTQHLAIAARIAAALMLCGRSAIAVDAAAVDTDLPIGELAGATEPVAAGEFAVTIELVRAATATALFSSRGARRLGIRHASFAAYLTASYLHRRQAPEHQLRALLTRTSSLGRTSVPTRLRETAAWLVALDPERHSWLVDLAPDTLAAHSALITDPRLRSTLVMHLLEGTDRDKTSSRRQWHLTHPGLADQLRPALLAALSEDAGPDFSHPVSRRAYTEIHIARQSSTQEVLAEIAAIATAPKLNPYLRNVAAHGLYDLDRVQSAAALRSVLDEIERQPDHDPNDDLRGVALMACWPRALSVEDLSRTLTGPRSHTYLGSYQGFLHRFVEDLTDDQLQAIVRAVAATATTGESSEGDAGWYDEDNLDPTTSILTGTRRSARLMLRLLERALQSPKLADFVDETAGLVAECIRQNRPYTLPQHFVVAGHDEDEGWLRLRHALLVAALQRLTPMRAPQLAWRWTIADPVATQPLRQLSPGLVRGDDLDWLFTLGQGQLAEHAHILIRSVFDPANRRHQEIVWEHRDEPAFAASVGHWFQPIDLDSEAATRMREEYESSASPPIWPGADSHSSAVQEAWTRCQSGDAEAFGDLRLLLCTDPETGRASVFEDDISNWPSLDLLDLDLNEFAAAARAYLVAVDVSAGDWSQTLDAVPYAALHGFSALAILARHPDSEAWFDGLPDEIWSRWATAIVRCPTYYDDTSRAVRSELLNQLAARVPDKFAAAYLQWVEDVLARAQYVEPLDPLAKVYDTHVGDRLATMLALALETVSEAHYDVLTTPTPESDNPEAPEASGSNRTDPVWRLSMARLNATNLARFLAPRGHAPTIELLTNTLGTAESQVQRPRMLG